MSELLVLRNHIDGAYTDVADGRRLEVTDPVTGEVYASSPLSGATDVDAAMAAAAAAFPGLARRRPVRPAAAAEDRGRGRGPGRRRSRTRSAVTPESRAPSPSPRRSPRSSTQIRFFAGAARLLEGRSAGVPRYPQKGKPMTRTRRPLAALLPLLVFFAVFAVLVPLGTGTARAESNGGVKVMPLGDSITDGFNVAGGYRVGLWQKFTAGRYKVDFVGSLFNGPAGLGDHDHEGHSGWTIKQIDDNVVNWLRAQNPHTILLHIGTNDIYGSDQAGRPPASPP
ncbi:hypothetical protein SANTM175S_00159 [Streptomyces antimycoticus]